MIDSQSEQQLRKEDNIEKYSLLDKNSNSAFQKPQKDDIALSEKHQNESFDLSQNTDEQGDKIVESKEKLDSLKKNSTQQSVHSVLANINKEARKEITRQATLNQEMFLLVGALSELKKDKFCKLSKEIEEDLPENQGILEPDETLIKQVTKKAINEVIQQAYNLNPISSATGEKSQPSNLNTNQQMGRENLKVESQDSQGMRNSQFTSLETSENGEDLFFDTDKGENDSIRGSQQDQTALNTQRAEDALNRIEMKLQSQFDTSHQKLSNQVLQKISKQSSIGVDAKEIEKLVKEDIMTFQRRNTLKLLKVVPENHQIDVLKEQGIVSTRTVSDRSSDKTIDSERLQSNMKTSGLKKLPLSVQNQIRQLMKPPKMRKAEDLRVMLPTLKNLQFFEKGNFEDASILKIISNAQLRVVEQGLKITKKGAYGDEMFVLLGGEATVVTVRYSFEKQQNNIIHCHKRLVELNNELLTKEQKQPKDRTEKDNIQIQELKVELLKQQLTMQLLRRKIRTLTKYDNLLTYQPGQSFGEIALLSGDNLRAATIIAKKRCYMMTIGKEDFKKFVERSRRKNTEELLSFFKKSNMFTWMSERSVLALIPSLKVFTANRYHQVVFNEDSHADTVLIVKTGEFEVFKQSLQNMDRNIFSFLDKGKERDKVAKKVLLLPGSKSIYQQTSEFFPPHEKMQKNVSIEDLNEHNLTELAFGDDKQKLEKIALQKAKQIPKQTASINSIKTSEFAKYKDQKISLHGPGFMYGDYEAIYGRRQYKYSVRACHEGATCLLISFKNFIKLKENAPGSLELKMEQAAQRNYNTLLKDLAKVVFNRWHTDYVQDNMRVVSLATDKDQDVDGDKNLLNENRGSMTAEQIADFIKKRERAQQVEEQIPLSRLPKFTAMKESAEQIIMNKGLRPQRVLLQTVKKESLQRQSEFKDEQQKMAASAAQSGSVAAINQAQQSMNRTLSPIKARKAGEKLENRLEEVTPIKILESKAYFNKKSVILRDQINEYVQGFPAMKPYRQFVQTMYGAENFPSPDIEQTKKAPNLEKDKLLAAHTSEFMGAKNMLSLKKGTQLAKGAKKDKYHLGNKVEAALNNNIQELPLDKQRLKRAIKVALLKNDNDHTRIDLDAILKEQMRIYKHIQSWKDTKLVRPKTKTTEDSKSKNQTYNTMQCDLLAEQHIKQKIQMMAKELQQRGESQETIKMLNKTNFPREPNPRPQVSALQKQLNEMELAQTLGPSFVKMNQSYKDLPFHPMKDTNSEQHILQQMSQTHLSPAKSFFSSPAKNEQIPSFVNKSLLQSGLKQQQYEYSELDQAPRPVQSKDQLMIVNESQQEARDEQNQLPNINHISHKQGSPYKKLQQRAGDYALETHLRKHSQLYFSQNASELIQNQVGQNGVIAERNQNQLENLPVRAQSLAPSHRPIQSMNQTAKRMNEMRQDGRLGGGAGSSMSMTKASQQTMVNSFGLREDTAYNQRFRHKLGSSMTHIKPVSNQMTSSTNLPLPRTQIQSVHRPALGVEGRKNRQSMDFSSTVSTSMRQIAPLKASPFTNNRLENRLSKKGDQPGDTRVILAALFQPRTSCIVGVAHGFQHNNSRQEASIGRKQAGRESRMSLPLERRQKSVQIGMGSFEGLRASQQHKLS